MKHYADSSFLVSCFLADANTPRAKAWLESVGVPLPFTDLHELEVPNALRLAVFRRAISQMEAASAISSMESDLAAGRLVKTSVDWRLSFARPHELAATTPQSMDLAASIFFMWPRPRP